MNEIVAAVLGALISCFAMLAANTGSKKEKYTVEIFRRLNTLETKLAIVEEKLQALK